MTLYADILRWSQVLPQWQRDALRRLATDAAAPTTTDIDELAVICHQEANNLPFTVAPQPLAAAHVPNTSTGSASVSLTAISDTQAINAIVDGQTLSFGPTGITAIYGDNGAGKSGFSRLLRHACHARGQSSGILPNVYQASPETPSATIHYLIDGHAHQATWTKAGSPTEALSQVAVFDTQAASELVEKDNVILWTPGGLDLFVRLSSVVDAVREHHQRALNATATPQPLPTLPAETAAGRFLKALGPTTAFADLDALQLNAQETTELQQLGTVLNAPDPGALAAQHRQRAQRLRGLATRIETLETSLGSDGMQQFQRERQAYHAALAAEQTLINQTFADSDLPGVGAAAWRTLWQAAEAYAATGATADGQFPSAEQPGHCVLCHQPLTTDARGRLARFHRFVRADVAQQREAAATAVRQRLRAIAALRVRESGDTALIGEIQGLDAVNGPNLAAVLDQATRLQHTIAGFTLDQPAWTPPEPLPPGWSAWLNQLAELQDRAAQAAAQSAQATTRATQIARHQELSARQTLIDARDPIQAEIKRLAGRAARTRSIQTCATTGISRKAGELTKTYVTDRLLQRFYDEARALRLPERVRYRPSRTEKGAAYQRVVLEAADWAGQSLGPVQVLSEGERRAVALATFLAELDTRDDRSAIVLDDPVSSLDHGRRRVVAKRLAECARDRQVIVFTHDLVFLHMLHAEAQTCAINLTNREIRCRGPITGQVRDRAPAMAMSTAKLVSELNTYHQQAAAHYRRGDLDAYERELTYAYGILREAWERAVEDILLNQTVQRFGHQIQTQRLKPIHDICPEDLQTIETAMTVCSRWLPGHAQAATINEPLPHPDDLRSEILMLDAFAKNLLKRRKG